MLKLLIYDKIKKSYKLVIPFFLAFILLFFAFKGIDINELLKNISQISIFYFILLIFFTITSHYIRSLRLKIIINGNKNISSYILFKSLLIGYAFNCIIPRSGEITRAIVTGIETKTPKSFLLGSIILERILDMIFFIISIIIAGMILGNNLFNYIPSLKYGLLITISIILTLNFLIFYLTKNAKSKEKIISIFNIIKNDNLRIKFIESFDKIILGYSSVKSLKQFMIIVFLSLMLMLNYGFNSLIGFWMLNNFSLSYFDAFAIMSIGAIGIFIPTPGGFGSFHIITNNVLIYSYKFDLTTASSYSFLMHITGYFIQIFLGIVFYLQFHFKYKDITLKELFGMSFKK
ncbi:MAG TPA: lysylphosphatidylglycerol synthase transmembrane domain-containing protein [Ignavibacteriales bacterium]|nr:lysylphosphatidylglycerol synthase transmembrane domain-containing protein [Ignavibacteriales bacterium]HOL81452.1 lysylphosphatidylglycerol synthase transmembrane domain-containing protein [Ignavibacteriales bacterium]HOM65350.1 lysylphosphatidylglycerol synthase transmembrane domain-containing protein [Ignavibacteriales bacterium]